MKVLNDRGTTYRDPRTLDDRAFEVEYQGFVGRVWSDYSTQGNVLELARTWATTWWVENEALAIEVPDPPAKVGQLELFGGAA